MVDGAGTLSRRRAVANVLATLVGATGLLVYLLQRRRVALVFGVYGLLMGTSTAVVTYCLTRYTGISVGLRHHERRAKSGNGGDPGRARRLARIFTGKALERDGAAEQDTGWLIGRVENVLVLTLIVAGQYTALSIIFAAKSWVRREDTASGNTTYYLAGTLVNFTYSIVVGIVAVRLFGL